MAITEAGRKAIKLDSPEQALEDVETIRKFVGWGQTSQEAVDVIIADANRDVDLARLEEARIELRDLDVVRGMVLGRIADLTSKLGLEASERP